MNEIIIRGKGNKYEIIDYLKGFSILTIVLMHLIQNPIMELPLFIIRASSLGGSGVHDFLLCSGFGLYYSYLKKNVNFTQFIKRRFLKIYIPYIIVVLVSAMIPFMYDRSDRILALLSHIFLFKMFVPEYEYSFGGQLWYMSTIIQFYLAFIPLCKMKTKIDSKKFKQPNAGVNKFLVISFIISVFWWILVAVLGLENERIWNSFFLQYLWEFALGMCIADYLYHGSDIVIKSKLLVPVSIISLLVTFLATTAGSIFRLFNDITSLIGYGGIALILFSIKYFEPIQKLIAKISIFSYEWYLVHILISSCIFHIISPEGLALQLLTGCIAFIISIITAYGYRQMLNVVKKVLYPNKIII